jgi:type II secretion system (T2SS) protein E
MLSAVKKKFGEILLERRLITPQQLADALDLQRRRGLRLGAALVARGHLSEHQLVQALGSTLNIKVVELADMRIAPAVIQLVQHRFCLEHELIPYALRKERGRRIVSVAMSDPLNYRVVDELSFVTDSMIEPSLARASDIDTAITRYYGRIGGSSAFGKDLDGTDLLRSPEHADPSNPNMAILRRGGVEEVVDTTGEVISPFIRSANGGFAEGSRTDGEPIARRPPPPREQSALLLTEEVPPSTPLDEPPRMSGAPLQAPPAPSAIPSHPPPVYSAPPGSANPSQLPTAPGMVGARLPAPPPSGPPPGSISFDTALGALLDAQGGAVDAEAFRQLERKFWAVMRILARKGILTNEDFLRELAERE